MAANYDGAQQEQVVEVWHYQILCPRESYEVASPKGDLFDPSKLGPDFVKVFEKVLDFWSSMHAMAGSSIMDFDMVPNPVFPGKIPASGDHSVRALVQLHLPDKIEKVHRRVSTLDGVLDMHCTLAQQFQDTYPDIGVWCYPESESQQNWWEWKPKPLECPKPEEWMHEWIEICKRHPHLREKLDKKYLEEDNQ